MSSPNPLFIGWDVGGWNCDHNHNSRDALVILDAQLAVVGSPWRGNLRDSINQAGDTRAFLSSLFALCGAAQPPSSAPVTLAIDACLGFSVAFT
ncbi:MAG: hypothetical protein IH586_04165, partial [Anaerolineaceae bacterium]|nr:hypothetical protein [Anaerolineaceae bacterium]